MTSACLSNATCLSQNPNSDVCCGIATVADTNFLYSQCIPTSGANKQVVYENFTYMWTCIPSTVSCIVKADCKGENTCCGNMTTSTGMTVMTCIDEGVSGSNQTINNYSGMVTCSNAINMFSTVTMLFASLMVVFMNL